MDPLPGLEVVRELARGGMGVVYLARDPGLDRQVVVKRILGDLSEDARARFEREAEVLARLNHPNVVRVHQAGIDSGGCPYLVLSYVEGQSMGQRLREGPLPWEEAAAICKSVADALAHAHGQGILHRDLKPDNVMVDAEGRVVLTDFGIAHDTQSEERLTQTGELVGTPGYMAPEQASGEAVDERVDVYGLGATLYALLSGGPPFRGGGLQVLTQVIRKQPPPLSSELPADLRSLCARAMAKDPSQRYPDTVVLARDLARVLAGDPLAWARARRSRLKPVLLLSVLLLAAGIGLALRSWVARTDSGDEVTPGQEPADLVAARAAREARALAREAKSLAREARAQALEAAQIAESEARGLAVRFESRGNTLKEGRRRLRSVEAWLSRSPKQHPRRELVAGMRTKLRQNVPLRWFRLSRGPQSNPRLAEVNVLPWVGDDVLLIGQGDGAKWITGQLAVFDPRTAKVRSRWTIPHVRRFAVREGPRSLIGGDHAPLTRYRCPAGEGPLVTEELEPMGAHAVALAIHPTLPLLARGYSHRDEGKKEQTHELRFFALGPGPKAPATIPYRARISGLAFSPDGERLAVLSGTMLQAGNPRQNSTDNELTLYDWRSRKRLRVSGLRVPYGNQLRWVGDRLIVGFSLGSVIEFDDRTLEERGSYRDPEAQSNVIRGVAQDSMIEGIEVRGGRLYSVAQESRAVFDRATYKVLWKARFPPQPDATSKDPMTATTMQIVGDYWVIGMFEGVVLVYALNP